VQDVLEKGLNDLMDLCDVVVEKFEDAKAHAKEHGYSHGDATRI